MAIVKAKLDDLDPCVDILFIPEMGQLYFPKKELLRSEMEKSINTDEIFVEKSPQDSKILGVIWYQRDSLFHSFPYLHMIAVRGDCRNQGKERAFQELQCIFQYQLSGYCGDSGA